MNNDSAGNHLPTAAAAAERFFAVCPSVANPFAHKGGPGRCVVCVGTVTTYSSQLSHQC